MTEPEFTVAKWGQMEPLADGTCHCGQPMKYNLAAGIVGHADPAVNATCTEPWPNVPNPVAWAMSRAMAATFERAGEAMDQAALGPRHAAGKTRTDDEEVTVARREQLTDVVLGRSLGEQEHPADHCDLDGQPHLGPCVEPGTRAAGTFRDEEQATLAPKLATGGVVRSGPVIVGEVPR